MPENERLQVKVFVCHNALAERLESGALRESAVAESCDVEQVPCLGKVDPRYLLRAFEGGCAGVCLIGCPIGECRTMDGNLRAQKRAGFVRRILEEIGMNGERLFLFLREPMGRQEFQEVMGEFLAAVRRLGASELKVCRETEPG